MKIIFIKFLNKNQIKTVTLENSLPSKKKNIIINACNKIEIPIICIASGLFTQKKKEIIGINFFEKIDFFLTPNLFKVSNKIYEIKIHIVWIPKIRL